MDGEITPEPSLLAQWCVHTVFALASLAFSLTVANLIYSKFEPERQVEMGWGHLHFLQYDPLVGWVNRPDSEDIFDYYGFHTHVHINHDGMRYAQVGEKKGFRVALVGDSIPFGYDVEEDERFSNIVEKDTGIQMLNFSVIGYNMLQYYLSIPKMLSFHPDLVLFVFTLNNDFNNVANIDPYVRGYSPYAALKDGKLNIEGYPVPNYTDYDGLKNGWLALHVRQYALGRLFYVTLHAYAPVMSNWLFDEKGKPAPPFRGEAFSNEWWLYNSPNSPETKKVMAINEALLKAIKQKLDEAHVPMMMFAIRTRIDRNNNVINQLKQMTSKFAIPLIYDSGSYDNNVLSLPNDEHWTPVGHRRGASVLEPYLISFAKKHAH